MTQREEIEQRIEEEGVDPQKRSKLVEMAQYGDVLATIWCVPGSPDDRTTSYILKFDHSGDFKADGLPFVGSDWESVRDGLLWSSDKLVLIFGFLLMAEGKFRS